jgi:hypothetical protein
MSKQNDKAGEIAEARTGYDYNPGIDKSEGGLVKVKTRSGEMVELPPGTKSLSDVVSGGVPMGSPSATTPTGSDTTTTPRPAAAAKANKSGDNGQS